MISLRGIWKGCRGLGLVGVRRAGWLARSSALAKLGEGAGRGSATIINRSRTIMSDAKEITEQIAKLDDRIADLGKTIDSLKKAGAPKPDIEAAIEQHRIAKNTRRELIEKTKVSALDDSKHWDNLKEEVENLLTQRFFITPSFEIYGGVAGLYDFGPPGCAIRDNIINVWKRHFILEENMLELFTSALTPEVVLQTSGHVERFTDFMVKDVKTGEPIRADHLLEKTIKTILDDLPATDPKYIAHKAIAEKAGDYNATELEKYLTEYKAKSPAGNDITAPFKFNLMFETQIGPSGKLRGFMRPETAQGIFTNFKRLLEFNSYRMPFAGAQIGPAFRNEISPRAGLLRVREFTLAEIEHFVHPSDKSHPKFANVASELLVLYPKTLQGLGKEETIQITAAEAVAKKIINNETLAYFIVRTRLFLEKIGINPAFIRFRQHKDTEMAHYASDCWDAEIRSSYGWVECVGHADRSCYDLERHSTVSKVDLSAYIAYDEPKIVTEVKVKVDKGKLGPKFRKEAPKVESYLNSLKDDEALALESKLAASGSAEIELCTTGEKFTVERNMVSVSTVTEKKTGERFVPAVIEPSFGIGRILYSLLEQAYYVRDGDEQRRVLRLKPGIAPTKVTVLPLSNDDAFRPFLARLHSSFISKGLFCTVDSSSAAIGKRYARADELGTPFGVTVDFDTLKTETVTVRERDTMNQIRVSIPVAIDIIEELTLEKTTWKTVYETHPKFFAQEASTGAAK